MKKYTAVIKTTQEWTKDIKIGKRASVQAEK